MLWQCVRGFRLFFIFALPAATRATAHRTKHFHGHSMPGLLLGDVFPDFEAETTTGTIKLHEFLGDSWVDFVTFYFWRCRFTDLLRIRLRAGRDGGM